MLNSEIDIEAPWPGDIDWADLVERAIEALVPLAPELANPRLSASVLFTSDAEVHALNREWRAKDKPTNVLSFPMMTRDQVVSLAPEGGPELPQELLGDIALAFETCAREAADKRVPVAHHAAHLVIHGLLHLAGHDHETGEEQAEAMEALETKALAEMGIADPYSAAT